MTASGEERAAGALTASGIDAHRHPARPRRLASRRRRPPAASSRATSSRPSWCAAPRTTSCSCSCPATARSRGPSCARTWASTASRCPTPPRRCEVTGLRARHDHAVRVEHAPGRSSPTRRSTGRTVSLGAGAHGVAATVAADDVVRRARRRRRRRHRPRLTCPSGATVDLGSRGALRRRVARPVAGGASRSCCCPAPGSRRARGMPSRQPLATTRTVLAVDLRGHGAERVARRVLDRADGPGRRRAARTAR